MVNALLAHAHRLADNKSIRSVLTKLRFPLWILCGVLVVMHAEREWFVPGVVISAVGALWQFWCLGALNKRKTLATSGPYCLMRNPMYLGRYFLLLGVLLLLENYWIPVLFTVLFYFYMVNRVKREEARLCVIFRQDYEEYCHDVRRFLPTLRRFNWRSLWFFRWNFFLKSHGHLHLAALLVLYGACAYFAYNQH